MSILQGLFRKTDNHTHTLNGMSEIISMRNEISNLKRSITLTNSRQRVSKKQRDALMLKVMNALDNAEGVLTRASND